MKERSRICLLLTVGLLMLSISAHAATLKGKTTVSAGVVSNVKSLIIVDTTRIIERRGVILTNFKTLTCVGVSHLELK